MPKIRSGSGKGEGIDGLVGRRLRQMREAREMSQSHVAEAAGVTFQQVQKYENGMTSVSLGRLDQFAKLFGTTVASILDGVEPAGRTADDHGPAYLAPDETELVEAYRSSNSGLKRSVLEVVRAAARPID